MRRPVPAVRTPGSLLVFVLTAVMSVSAWAALPAAVDDGPLPSLAPMLERVTPAVVNISTVSVIRTEEHPLLSDPFFRRFFDLPKERERRKNQSLGSGVIIDADQGHVLTNNHVIEKADEVRVTLNDGRVLTATVLGADPDTDVAVLRIPAENLKALPLADSDRLRVGDFVVAIGNPFGLRQTVTSGIVSALGRSGLGIEGYESFIQTDASINPGNSGGPLVNLRGELVGINTAILAPGGGNVGIGFAIPVNMARVIKDQIVQYGGVNRGVFGIGIQELTPELARALNIRQRRGAVVAEVRENSAAQRAGVQVGDVIVAVNGRPVPNGSDLRTQLALLRIGDQVDLTIMRNGIERRLNARIGDPFEHYVEGGKVSRYFRGALLSEILDDSPLGELRAIAVGPVREDSNAWNIGLRPDDVILEANQRRVQELADLRSLAGAKGGIWALKLRRGQQIITLVSR